MHIPLCYYLVRVVGLGEFGLIIAMNVTQFLNLLCINAYCYFENSVAESWPGLSWDRRTWNNMDSFLAIVIPGAIMMSVRWWANDF